MFHLSHSKTVFLAPARHRPRRGSEESRGVPRASPVRATGDADPQHPNGSLSPVATSRLPLKERTGRRGTPGPGSRPGRREATGSGRGRCLSGSRRSRGNRRRQRDGTSRSQSQLRRTPRRARFLNPPRPRVRRGMLPSFRSQCRMPRRWAYPIALQTSRSAARVHGNPGHERRIRWTAAVRREWRRWPP